MGVSFEPDEPGWHVRGARYHLTPHPMREPEAWADDLQQFAGRFAEPPPVLVMSDVHVVAFDRAAWAVIDARLAKVHATDYVARKRRPHMTRSRRVRAKARQRTSPYAARLESARRAFTSDAKVAEALGVDRAQVKRWREGETEPGAENADRVVGLDAAVALLSGYLEPTSIPKWLMGHNAHLGDRRPVDLLREGNLSDVIAAIEALKSGAYA